MRFQSTRASSRMEPLKASLSFINPLKSVYLAGQGTIPRFSAEDMSRARQEARQETSEAVSQAYDEQVTKLKADVSAIVERILSGMVQKHEDALEQVRTLLPDLVREAMSRVVSGITWEENAIKGVVVDLLAEVAPGAENVEVQLCRVDLARLEKFQPQMRQKFPTLQFSVNDELGSGDCIVKTRFGVLDGRISTKIQSVASLLT
jgi:flagellar assembly protein FliH